jgi:hypothetical protein
MNDLHAKNRFFDIFGGIEMARSAMCGKKPFVNPKGIANQRHRPKHLSRSSTENVEEPKIRPFPHQAQSSLNQAQSSLIKPNQVIFMLPTLENPDCFCRQNHVRGMMLRIMSCLAVFALAFACPAQTISIEQEIPAPVISVAASSEYSASQSARHLIDGSGLANGRHDNQAGAQTMWHSTFKPAPQPPASGLAPSPAWVKFDFAQPQKFDAIRIWNHNQANLTDRGFRHTRVYGSTDGTAWFPLTSPETVELPRASGGDGAEAVTVSNAAPARSFQSVIIAAAVEDGNYGSDYYGLSAVRFVVHREVAEADLPVPTNMTCAALPYCPYRPDGTPGRQIAVTLRGASLYQEVTLDVQCAGATERTALPANARGADTFTVFLPAGVNPTNACVAAVSLHSGRAALQQTVSVPALQPRTFYILMHSHCDIGYTDLQPRVAAKEAQNVVRALELIEQTKDYPPEAQFRWNTEVFWQADQFYNIATPEQKQKFEQAVREHRIEVDPMYGNLLTGLARGEELLRQFKFATELGRRCGGKVDTMLISDVPGLTWGIVPSLAQAGIKYISDGPNESDRIGYVRRQWENQPFVWLSPSGNERVLYWGAQGGYSIGHHCGSIRDAIAELTPQLDQAGYPYDMVQLRWTKGDDGPPDETVMPAVRDWNATHAWPKLVITTASEMFHLFDSRYGASLPVFRGDLTPYWEDGAGSSARETGLNRLSSDRMIQGEILWTMLKPQALPTDAYAAALKNIALFTEHTWGAYNSVSQPDSDFVKSQWKFKQDFALQAETETKNLLAAALATRGPAPDTATAIDVFNTASWPRTDWVTLPATMKLAGDIVKTDHGQIVPSQRLARGELVFIAPNIPPFSGRRFTLLPGSAPAQGMARAQILPPSDPTSHSPLTTNHYFSLSDATITLKLNPESGAIASLRLNGVDHEFVDPAAGLGLNEYIYLPGGNTNNARRNGPVKISVLENGPLVASLLVESDAPGCNKLLREIRLVDGLDRVEITDTLDKKAVRAVEGVHIGFAFNVPDPAVRINIPWAVIQPEKDQLPGACKNWFTVERWVDISNDRLGVTWSTLQAPLLEIGGLTANLPRSQPNPTAYLWRIAASPTIYSWVMNNHWHTNYRADQEGDTVFCYAIRPHAVYDQTAAAHFGVETTEPLLAAPAAGPPPSAPLVEISPGPVMITSLQPGPDGRALLLRLYNTGPTPAPASLRWNALMPKAISVSDLAGLPGAPVTGTIQLAPYELRTLRAELP